MDSTEIGPQNKTRNEILSPIQEGRTPTPVRPLSRRGVLAGIVGVASAAIIGSDSRTKATAQLTRISASPESTREKPYYDPTPEEIKKVEALFDQPGKPEFSPEGKSSEDIENHLTQVSLDASRRYGLTLYDYRTFYRELSHDAYKNTGPQYNFDTYFQKTQEFLDHYGIELVLEGNHQKYNYDGKPLTREILEQAKVKQSLVSLIGTLGELPVELVKEIGLKKINMITIPDKKVAGYADIDLGDTYHFDPTKFFGTGLIHEAYHLYDVNHSDPLTMHWDRGFRKLNPSEQIYTAEFIKSQNYGDYISKEEYDALTVKGDDTKKAARVVVSSDYSFTNVAEDKAELGSNILDSFLISGVLDRKMPILRRKALFLLARLYHDNPAFVQFYAAVSDRQS